MLRSVYVHTHYVKITSAQNVPRRVRQAGLRSAAERGTNQPSMSYDPANHAGKVHPFLSIGALVKLGRAKATDTPT